MTPSRFLLGAGTAVSTLAGVTQGVLILSASASVNLWPSRLRPVTWWEAIKCIIVTFSISILNHAALGLLIVHIVVLKVVKPAACIFFFFLYPEQWWGFFGLFSWWCNVWSDLQSSSCQLSGRRDTKIRSVKMAIKGYLHTGSSKRIQKVM